MLGLQARDAGKPVASECTSKARRPLKDIDVNRSHHSIHSSKDGRNTGKANVSSGFQVFADGETSSTKKVNVKVPVKSSATDAKLVVGGNKPCQDINGISGKKTNFTKDIGAIIAEEIENGFKANRVACNTSSSSDRAFAKTAAPNTKMNWLEKQIALMQVEKGPNNAQNHVPATDPQNVEGGKKAVSTVIPCHKEIDTSTLGAEQLEDIWASFENLGLKEERKPANTNDTGAIRKVVSNEACATEVKHVNALPTYTLNVMAQEWNGTASKANKESLYNGGHSSKSSQPTSDIQLHPTFWDNILASNTEPNLPNQYADATGTYLHDNATATHPTGRKIVGRKCPPLEKRRQPTQNDILRELDDRTEEIQRFERYKEARRRKAIEAMRIEQERVNRTSVQRQAEPINKNRQMQPTTNYPATRATFVNGFEDAMNISLNQKPIQPPSATVPVAKPNFCIIKYPTPPNVPIRYEPEDILKLNFTQNKNPDKRQDDGSHYDVRFVLRYGNLAIRLKV
uniref:Uncharacterized protein n=1 Tax=Anopheles culicifacies TaxID=139723 RepID=A0A182MUJ8_9DIPT